MKKTKKKKNKNSFDNVGLIRVKSNDTELIVEFGNCFSYSRLAIFVHTMFPQEIKRSIDYRDYMLSRYIILY